MTQVYPAFDVEVCALAEPTLRSEHVSPRQWAEALAYYKARSVAERFPERWVLGADTIVVCSGRLLGKARDAAEARRMLEWQAREPSDVITGVCLLRHGRQRKRLTQAETTRVWMRDDPVAREAYVAGGDWEGKAGAYGIQDVGDRLVMRIEGSFSNVVGLPLELVTRMLARVGLAVRTRAGPGG